jgi:hypothetical protein
MWESALILKLSADVAETAPGSYLVEGLGTNRAEFALIRESVTRYGQI